CLSLVTCHCCYGCAEENSFASVCGPNTGAVGQRAGAPACKSCAGRTDARDALRPAPVDRLTTRRVLAARSTLLRGRRGLQPRDLRVSVDLARIGRLSRGHG